MYLTLRPALSFPTRLRFAPHLQGAVKQVGETKQNGFSKFDGKSRTRRISVIICCCSRVLLGGGGGHEGSLLALPLRVQSKLADAICFPSPSVRACGSRVRGLNVS